MPVERSQGKPRPQVPRADELPAGVAAPSGQADAATPEELALVKRGDGGKVADTESAAALGRLGGLAKAESQKQLAESSALIRKLGLGRVSAAGLLPYFEEAEAFARTHIEALAKNVGGGTCGFAPSSMVQSAALQLAGSRFAFANGDLTTGSRLADASRANLLSAHELAAREADRSP